MIGLIFFAYKGGRGCLWGFALTQYDRGIASIVPIICHNTYPKKIRVFVKNVYLAKVFKSVKIMKKSLCLLLVLLMALSIGCKKEESIEESPKENKEALIDKANAKEMICRKWYVNKVELEEDEMKNMPEEVRVFARKIYSSIKMEFKEGGVGQMSFPGMETQSGKWELSEEGTRLVFIDEKDGSRAISNIEKLTKEEMILLVTKDGKTVKLFLKPSKQN